MGLYICDVLGKCKRKEGKVMGLRFRKSFKIAPGVKLNLNKKSTSVTFGGKGFHHTISSTGKKTTTVGVPGTGISYSKTSGRNRGKASSSHTAQSSSFLPDPTQRDDKKWHEKTGWIIFFLIVFFPIGLFLMWKSNWKKAPKIIVSALYGLAVIAYIASPKLESVTLSADTEQIYDINSEISIEVSTEPENYSLSESSFNISGGQIIEKEGAFVFSASKEGEYTVSVGSGNVDSNKLTFSIEDKAAIAKANAEAEAQEQKEAEEKARAEQEASEKAASEQAAAEQAATQAQAEQEAAAQTQQPQEQMVWISQSGSKYHSNSSCSNMKNPTQITISEAQNRGLEPCKKCY